jgi:hypothetical protein
MGSPRALPERRGTTPRGSGSPPAAIGYDAADNRFFGHPRGLSTLFLTEMCERFSYYGIRPLLVLFMSAALAEGGFGFDRGEPDGRPRHNLPLNLIPVV